MKDELPKSQLLKIAIEKMIENYDGDYDEFSALNYLFELYRTNKADESKEDSEQ